MSEFNSFYIGTPLNDERGAIGLRTSEIESKALSNGIVAILGGYRSGKSTEALFAKKRLMRRGYEDLGVASFVVNENFIREKMVEVENAERILGHNKRGVMIMEEVSWQLPKDVIQNALEWMDGLKRRGHIVLAEFNGDFRFPNGYIDETVRKKLVDSFGSSIEVKSLLNDDVVRKFAQRAKHTFGGDNIEWIVQEAGGHPYVAQVVASVLFDGLQFKQSEQVVKNIIANLRQFQEFNGRLIREAGYSILDLHNESGPQAKFYQNIIPRPNSKDIFSTIFYQMAKPIGLSSRRY